MFVQIIFITLFLLGLYALSLASSKVLKRVAICLLVIGLTLFILSMFAERQAAFVAVIPSVFCVVFAGIIFLIDFIKARRGK